MAFRTKAKRAAVAAAANGHPITLVPTDEERRAVRVMVGAGLGQEDIARLLNISVDSLARHFRADLDAGNAAVLREVAGELFRKAMSDHPGAVTAAIFWLKARGGWRDSTNVDLTSAGQPIGPIFNMYLHPSVQPDPDPDE